ncbi:DMT family transporter [Polaromonas sp.]|uniref:DMT family transporter n=1 Tax=Polaromonas sp. TaxID=1869339 RepID=UPI003CAE9F96
MSSPASTGALIRAMPAVFVLIWSTGFIVAKYGLPYAPPLSFLAIRYVLSLACFLVWIAIARVAWPRSGAQWLHLGVTGILIHGGYLGGVWSAIKGGMGSGLSALIVGLQPVLTAVWVSRMGDSSQSENRVSARQWLGLVLGLAGLLLVVSRKFGAGNEATPSTLAFAVFALLSITIGTLYQKRFVQAADVRSANAIQLGAALLVTLPFAWMETEPVVPTAEFLGALAWSVLALTLGGSSLLYMLIQRGAATAVTSLLYLVPPTTALMAWLLFGEAITVVTVLGTALTALGVWLVVRTGAKAAA